MRFILVTVLMMMSLITTSCKKEKKPIDPLSYLKLIEEVKQNDKIEQSRTQLVSLKTQGDTTNLVLAFAMDSQIPKNANKSPNNAYAIRFTLQDSLLRSKRLGGGTFVLKFKKTGNSFSIRNFKKEGNSIIRYPSYNVDSMDTIINPEIIDIKDTKSNQCIAIGCKGVLTPLKERVYSITITFRNIAGDVWTVDQGYLNTLENKEPNQILNKTNAGIKIEFPSDKLKGTEPNYDLNKLGSI